MAARADPGTVVLESDRFWAALLSLEDAEDLLREARRLRWYLHPRGDDNTHSRAS